MPNFVLKNTLSLDSVFCFQIKETAMGSICAPSYTNVTIGYYAIFRQLPNFTKVSVDKIRWFILNTEANKFSCAIYYGKKPNKTAIFRYYDS